MKIFDLTRFSPCTLTLALFLSALFMPLKAGAVIVDRVVAVVNDKVITLYELEQKAQPLFARFIPPDMTDEVEIAERKKQIMAQVLPQLIDDVLVQEEIEKKGLTATNQEVEQTIQAICAQNGLTREEFAKKLESQGYSLEQYKKQVKQQIERSRLINSEVKSKIVVTDQEISRYYSEISGGGDSYNGPYYDISMINIAPDDPDDPASKAEAEKKAIEAYKKLKAGTPFDEVAAEYTNPDTNTIGGHLGKFSADEMDPFIRDIIIKLAPGEVSKIVDMPSGYQIFKLNGISSSIDVKVPEEEKEEIRKKLYDKKMEERFQEWLDDLRAKSAIRILL